MGIIFLLDRCRAPSSTTATAKKPVVARLHLLSYVTVLPSLNPKWPTNVIGFHLGLQEMV